MLSLPKNFGGGGGGGVIGLKRRLEIIKYRM